MPHHQITIRLSELSGADKIKLFRLFSLQLARAAILDPSLAGQFSAGQVTALQNAIDTAVLAVQDNTASALGYTPKGRVKVQATPSGKIWFELEYKNSNITNINAIDTKVTQIDVRIVTLESELTTDVEQRAAVQASIDAGDSLEEVSQIALEQTGVNSEIQSQLEALNAERDTLLALKAKLES